MFELSHDVTCPGIQLVSGQSLNWQKLRENLKILAFGPELYATLRSQDRATLGMLSVQGPAFTAARIFEWV
jgi:hypothetical protein